MSRANSRAWQIQRGFDLAKEWLKRGSDNNNKKQLNQQEATG